MIQLIGRYEAPVSPKKSNKAQEVRCHNVDFGIRNVRRFLFGILEFFFLTGSSSIRCDDVPLVGGR